MNVDLAQELLDELGSSLKNLETEQAALLQFLKDNGVLSDEQFAPYLEQAGKASSVRWRAAHTRLERLFSSERQKEEELREDEKRQADAGLASTQNQNHESDKKSHEDSAPAPWTGEAKINRTADGSAKQNESAKQNGSAKQSTSAKEDRQDVHAEREEKLDKPSNAA